MKKLRIISLCALFIMIIISVDLGLNYFNATFISQNDGINCISIFRMFFNKHWTLFGFFDAFSKSIWITLFIALFNIILTCIKILKEK